MNIPRSAADIAAWREVHPGRKLHLFGADLSGTDLSGADLSAADLDES
jgi:uncharacterized protein YjbI with pentapeptide repeats